MQVHALVGIDTRTITDCQDEIRAFMTVRDEILLLLSQGSNCQHFCHLSKLSKKADPNMDDSVFLQ